MNDRHTQRSGETADVIAMRSGRMSREDYEARYGVTNTAYPRHAEWYAEHRAQVEADPTVREFRAAMRRQGRAVAPGAGDVAGNAAEALRRSNAFDAQYPQYAPPITAKQLAKYRATAYGA